MKTVLVTGANGFIGGHTLNYLANVSGINVIAACRDKSKLSKAFKGEVREGDFRDEAYLESLLDGVDVVINAMAWTCLWGRKQESEALFYQPTIKFIDIFMRSQASRFINVSTTAAASPGHSTDALAEGVARHFWPHQCNVVKIENYLRQHAKDEKTRDEKTIVNMRLGIFAGEGYGLGILPILLPRLKTHLVPWVQGGRTHLDMVDGRDLGQAMGLAALKEGLQGFQSFNIVGKDVPTVREIINFLNDQFGLPKPHFSVPFFMAYRFAWLMEKIDPLVPWEPLIVRSIIHILEDTHADNHKAYSELGYQPQYDWRDAIRVQVKEMEQRQLKPMSMAVEIK